MKTTFSKGLLGMLLVAAMLATAVLPAFAQKATPATDKNSNVPAVPRAIPDLMPYHKYDPPNSPAFDMKNLTISGDMRVRPEFRSHALFGVGESVNNFLGVTADPDFTPNASENDFFTQQLIRLGFNYSISPDVTFFVQPQVSHNFGTENVGVAGGVNPNDGAALFLRQGFMLIRNFGVENLSVKAGRQLVVWGNHRIFGHFDWNNIGFAFDGVTTRYNHPMMPVELGWLRVAESDLAENAGGTFPNTACMGTACNSANSDGDILFARLPMKVGGIAIEPAWIWESGGAGGGITPGASPATMGQVQNQSRHTLGARAAGKAGMLDATAEGYYQFGTTGVSGGPRNLHINALAFHVDVGATLFGMPMQPRIGAEVNYATGDGDNGTCAGANANNAPVACGGNVNTFSQLFPTNHIHFGYMDLMAWQNMLTWGGNIQLRPTKESHFEAGFHIMRLANRRDNWYRANQGVFLSQGQITSITGRANQKASLGQEVDVVYTLFFMNNKVGWQLGYGHFFAGEILDQFEGPGNAIPGVNVVDQDWGYTQLWINF